MRIYNKKTFGFGIFALALGLLNIVAGVMTGFDGKGVFLIVLLFLIGAGSLARSLSQKMSREDKLEERDERNQLIDMKSKSLAFRLTQGISFVLGLLFLVSGAVAKDDAIVALGLGFLFTVTISMFGKWGPSSTMKRSCKEDRAMKRIKSRRQMAAGIIALVLALLCFAVLLLAGYQARFLAAGVLALAWSAVSFSLALFPKGHGGGDRGPGRRAGHISGHEVRTYGPADFDLHPVGRLPGQSGPLRRSGAAGPASRRHHALRRSGPPVFHHSGDKSVLGKAGVRPSPLRFRSPDLWDIFSPSPA